MSTFQVVMTLVDEVQALASTSDDAGFEEIGSALHSIGDWSTLESGGAFRLSGGGGYLSGQPKAEDGFIIVLIFAGPSTARPASPFVGMTFFDATIDRPIRELDQRSRCDRLARLAPVPRERSTCSQRVCQASQRWHVLPS